MTSLSHDPTGIANFLRAPGGTAHWIRIGTRSRLFLPQRNHRIDLSSGLRRRRRRAQAAVEAEASDFGFANRKLS
jgi:hypothetical protein